MRVSIDVISSVLYMADSCRSENRTRWCVLCAHISIGRRHARPWPLEGSQAPLMPCQSQDQQTCLRLRPVLAAIFQAETMFIGCLRNRQQPHRASSRAADRAPQSAHPERDRRHRQLFPVLTCASLRGGIVVSTIDTLNRSRYSFSATVLVYIQRQLGFSDCPQHLKPLIRTVLRNGRHSRNKDGIQQNLHHVVHSSMLMVC